MIQLHFAVCPPVGRQQQYQVCMDDKNLDLALDLINQYVQEGYVLHWVYLLEDRTPMSLPTAAFDGQPIGEHLRALQQQWQCLLER